MSIRVQLGMLILFAAVSASASELAVLRNGFSIRHERREVRGELTRLYTSTDGKAYVDVPSDQIEHFEKDDTPPPQPIPQDTHLALAPLVAADPGAAPAATLPIAKPALNIKNSNPAISLNEMVNQASDQTQIDADLISSVIRAESGFNTRAVSPKGARGLMQLMPQTANQLGVPNAFDPQANVDGGTRYLRWLLDHYNYDLPKALAAYNAGPHRVDKYHGVPPYYETQAYVARIIRDFNRKKLAQKKAEAAAAKKAAKITKSTARATQSAQADALPQQGSAASTR
jgi:soluble lytic murein transglycosylase-like protein